MRSLIGHCVRNYALMFSRLSILSAATVFVGAAILLSGCGTTRSTDTTRTATEQLLVSDAIDRAVQTMNFKALSGQTVFLDDTKLTDTVDKNYYISTLRQQLLASGCELRDKRDDADFVVEARAGAIGTDRNDLLFGIPATNVPQIPLVQPVPAAIPEIPIAKRKDQRGVAKIAVFAYHRATGTPVWQSGLICQESSSNDVWIFGAGPFQRGTIYEGTEFAGGPAPKDVPDGARSKRNTVAGLSKETLFTSPSSFVKQSPPAAVPAAIASTQKDSAPGAPKPATQTAAPASSVASNAAPVQSPAAVPAAPATPPPVNAAVVANPKDAIATAVSATANGTGNLIPTGPSANLPLSTAYAKSSDVSPLPQPRFNSPQ
jgi:hypothetical protein